MILRILFCLMISACLNQTYAFTWADLWKTRDQQGQQLMEKKQYQKAKEIFIRQDWAGTAAYRAGDYKKAHENFAAMGNEQGFYNQGNALAHTGDYAGAIKAYDKALAINPENQDALYNRNLIKDLMKKDKEKQEQQEKNRQDKDQQKQNQQDKNDQNRDQQGKHPQNQDKQKQQNAEDKNRDQEGKNPQNQDKQDKDRQDKDRQNKDQQEKDQQDDKQDRKALKKDQPEKNAREKAEEQAAKEQWLKLVPDDPGGLMRQKFLRDYLKRQGGWN